jgi:hypothetical protein
VSRFRLAPRAAAEARAEAGRSTSKRGTGERARSFAIGSYQIQPVRLDIGISPAPCSFSSGGAGSIRGRASSPGYAMASFRAFTGRPLRTLRAGLALNTVGSFVKGLIPCRALVAGFLMTRNFAKPGITNTPFFLSSL